MTLTLTPDTEALLQSVAAQYGLPPEKTIEVLLAEAQAAAETDHREAVVGIQRGMDDFAAGHWISLEDYEAQTQAEAEEELVAELRASVEDHAAGRSMTIEEYRSGALARRQDQRHAGMKQQPLEWQYSKGRHAGKP